MMRYACSCLFVLIMAAGLSAQQRLVFDPDDFVDPRQHDDVPVFISRLVAGGAWNFIDDYRPARQDVGFVHVANSFYFRRFQFDYKRSEVLGGDPPPVSVCACSPPIYFPTPPAADAVPAAPPPGSKNAFQLAWYWRHGDSRKRVPVMLRYRLTWSRQTINTDIVQPGTNETLARLSGREQSFGLDADTWVPIAGRDIFGSLQYERSSRRGTIDDRTQHTFVYTSRFPGVAYKRVLFRAKLAVGGISDRGGTAINVINPSFEAFLHEERTKANFHLVWSPQILNDGANGWRTTHQVALFADRALFVRLFRAK